MGASLQEMPEERDLVLSTVQAITPHGAYVTLDEYGGANGFLHISEISTGWVRNIERHVKPGQKVVLKVIRVNKARGEVDVSLRQVTGEERKEKLIEVKRSEKARVIMEQVKSRLNLSPEDSEKYQRVILEKYGFLYGALEDVTRNGGVVLKDTPLPQQYISVLEQVAREKIVIPTVTVKGVMEISCRLPHGVEVIRQALTSIEEGTESRASVQTIYLGAPKYRITVTAENYKIAEKALDDAVAKAKSILEKNRGSLAFRREG